MSQATAQRLSARGKVAALSRSRPADDPELINARRELTEAQLREFISARIAEAPPLGQEQIDRIVTILRGGAQ